MSLAAMVAFCDAEAAGLENHARLVARSHGEQDRATIYSRNRASTFRAIAAELRARADRFREQNPEVRLVTPLIDAGLSKEDCHATGHAVVPGGGG